MELLGGLRDAEAVTLIRRVVQRRQVPRMVRQAAAQQMVTNLAGLIDLDELLAVLQKMYGDFLSLKDPVEALYRHGTAQTRTALRKVFHTRGANIGLRMAIAAAFAARHVDLGVQGDPSLLTELALDEDLSSGTRIWAADEVNRDDESAGLLLLRRMLDAGSLPLFARADLMRRIVASKAPVGVVMVRSIAQSRALPAQFRLDAAMLLLAEPETSGVLADLMLEPDLSPARRLQIAERFSRRTDPTAASCGRLMALASEVPLPLRGYALLAAANGNVDDEWCAAAAMVASDVACSSKVRTRLVDALAEMPTEAARDALKTLGSAAETAPEERLYAGLALLPRWPRVGVATMNELLTGDGLGEREREIAQEAVRRYSQAP